MRGCATPLFSTVTTVTTVTPGHLLPPPAVSPHLLSRQATMAFAAASASCRTGRATSKVKAGNSVNDGQACARLLCQMNLNI